VTRVSPMLTGAPKKVRGPISASSGSGSGGRIRDLGLSTGTHGEPYLDAPTETH
jgi:hypothetical protein